MNVEVSLAAFSVAGLAHRCREETERFYRRLQVDERYCFELFRRAIRHRSEQAWNLIVRQYTHQVTAWIQRHESFAGADEACDYFVNHAFARFWRAFNRDPHKLDRFSGLKPLLQYLKLCAHSAIKEHVQRHMHPGQLSLSEHVRTGVPFTADPAATVDGQLGAERLWQRVLEIVKTDQERIVAEAYLIHDMKPREIFAWREDAFSDIVQVRRVKDNFLTRLRRDAQLLAILAGHV